MKIGILSYALLFSALIGCGASKDTSNLKDEFSGDSFYYYDRADRITMLEDLRNETLAKYSLVELKKERLGIDGEVLFANALAEEAASADPVDGSAVEQATSNLAFFDRVKKVIAGFKDTHFSPHTKIALPAVTNGLSIKEVDGHYYVVSRNLGLLATTAANSTTSAASRIELGDEVLAIDGALPQDLVNQLIPYESASSQDFAQGRATDALTWRSYRYPENGFSDWTFKSASNGSTFSARLSWYYKPTSRKDALLLLKSRGFESAERLKMSWDPLLNSWKKVSMPWSGYDEYAPAKNAIAVSTWDEADSPGTPALRTSMIVKGGKAYGVIQLYTYMLDKVVQGDTTVNWDEPLIDFIKELKANGTPLILDLRNNGGGSTSIPGQVLSLIARPGEEYAGAIRGYRVTRSIRQMIEQIDNGDHPDLNGEEPSMAAIEVIKAAIAGHKKHTRVFSSYGNVYPSSATEGFDLPVVALVSPYCISACDIQSMLLKGSGRVKIIGTHSNGTGAGYQTMGEIDSTDWTDPFDVLTMGVPNHLFGYSGDKDHLISTDDNDYSAYISENRPTVADVQYSPTLRDYLDDGADWFDKAVAELAQ